MQENSVNDENIRYITETKVKQLLQWDETIEATEVALLSVVNGRAIQNPRTFTNVLNTKNVLLTMPGFLSDKNYGALGCKLVTAFPNNATNMKIKLPTIIANILIFDENTGQLQAIVAGTEITKWRTAAASVVATKYLHPKNNQILSIVGAGAQGEIHAIALQRYFKFKEVRIWNRTQSRAQLLVEKLRENPEIEGNIMFCENVQSCVNDADVVVTATFSEKPLVQLEWLKDGVHINAIGAGVTHYSELEEAIYKNSNIYVDHRESAKKELNGLLEMGLEFRDEIGNVISGKTSVIKNKKVTIFHSLGMAVEDCAMARLVYNNFLKTHPS